MKWEAKFLTVVADEVAYISSTKQMSIVLLRYIDNQCEIKEEFIAFTSSKGGTTGEALFDNILSVLWRHRLDFNLLRGQAYDGAGAIAGSISGVAVRIRSLCPLALYTHCFLTN